MIATALLFGWIAGIATDPIAQDQIDLDTRRVLAGKEYGFCHEDDYPLTEHEARWCPFADEAAGRCPSFAKACEAPRAELTGQGRFSTRAIAEEGQEEEREQKRGKKGGSSQRKGQAEPEPEPEPESDDPVRVPTLGGLAELLFWAVIGIGLLALVIAIMRNLAPSRREEDEAQAGATQDEDADQPSAAAAARIAMETDVERLLALAEQAASRNDYAAAVDFAHAALLRRLDHDGLIRLHRSRTNGDYIRDLRSHPQLRDPVRDALRRIDRAQFGTVAPDGNAFGEIVGRVRDIVRMGAGGLVVVAVLLTMWACRGEPDTRGPEPQEDAQDRSYPWSTSPSGSDGLEELLKLQGHEVDYESGSLTEPPDAYGTNMVVLSGAEVSAEEWDALQTWVRVDGGTLIVASGAVPPFVDGVSIEGRFGVAKRHGLQLRVDPGDAAGGDPAPLVVGETFRSQMPVPLVFAPQDWELSSARDRPDEVLLQRRGKPYALSMPDGMGRIVILPSDHLFTNASLAMGDNAVFVTALLTEEGYRTVFVDAWTSAGAQSPLESIRNSHMTPVMLQLLALLALLYLWRGIPFGKGRDPAPPSRRSFTQHARAMALQYARARAKGHAASAYAAWALERLRDRYPTAARGGLHALALTLARKSGRDETEVMRLLVEAHGAAEGGTSADGAGDLGLVRELGALMRQTGGMK